MLPHNFAMMFVALVITTQIPVAHAQGNMTPSGDASSAEKSPANAAAPRGTIGTTATRPTTGEPATSVAELPQDLSPWGHHHWDRYRQEHTAYGLDENVVIVLREKVLLLQTGFGHACLARLVLVDLLAGLLAPLLSAKARTAIWLKVVTRKYVVV
jgi:hypothetical protein